MAEKLKEIATQFCKDRHQEEYDDPTFQPDVTASYECFLAGIKKGIELEKENTELVLANAGVLTGKSAEKFHENMKNPKPMSQKEIDGIKEAQKLVRKISKEPSDLKETVDWFREKHNIVLEMLHGGRHATGFTYWGCKIFKPSNGLQIYINNPDLTKNKDLKDYSYYEALSEAIKEAFKLI